MTEVKIAKRIKYKIGDKANIGDVEELYDVEGNRFESFDDDAAPPPPPEAPAPPAVPPPIVAPAAPPIAAAAAAQPVAAADNASGMPSLTSSSLSGPSASAQKRAYQRSLSDQSQFLEVVRMQTVMLAGHHASNLQIFWEY